MENIICSDRWGAQFCCAQDAVVELRPSAHTPVQAWRHFCAAYNTMESLQVNYKHTICVRLNN